MAKKQNVYNTVSYDKLRNQVKEVLVYISSENMENIEDSIHYRTAAKGGVIPSITVTIEKKIDTQVRTITSCCEVLKALLEKEGLSEFVLLGITSLNNKLVEIQDYFEKRPLTTIKDRMLPLNFGKGTVIDTLAASKETQVNFSIETSKKILKIIPLINELESLKEAIQVKGGYEIRESMLY